jgi:hypothetical protein
MRVKNSCSTKLLTAKNGSSKSFYGSVNNISTMTTYDALLQAANAKYHVIPRRTDSCIIAIRQPRIFDSPLA